MTIETSFFIEKEPYLNFENFNLCITFLEIYFFEQILPFHSSLNCKLLFEPFLVTIDGCMVEKLR